METNTELIVVIQNRETVPCLSLEWSPCLKDETVFTNTNTNANVKKNAPSLQTEVFKRFENDGYLSSSTLLFLGFSCGVETLSPSLAFFRKFAQSFIEKCRSIPDIESFRNKLDNLCVPIVEEELELLKSGAPFLIGGEILDLHFMSQLWEELNIELISQIDKFQGSIEDFFHAHNPNVYLVGKVFFHLVENKDNTQYPFAFLATYSHSINKKGGTSHLALKHALEEYGDDSEKLLNLLVTVHRAAENSLLIKELLDSGEIFHPISFTASDAFQFLQEIAIYEDAGVLCRIPNWWRTQTTNTLKVGINVGPKNQGLLGLDSILEFHPQILLNGESISLEEARKIYAATEGLTLIKGKWTVVDHDKLKQILSVYDRTQKLAQKENGLSFRELLQLQLGTKKSLLGKINDGGQIEEEQIEISHSDWLNEIFNKLKNPQLIKTINPSKDFLANLRPYQQSGLNWIYLLHTLKLGGCLADDMGLGKTVQILAFLDLIKGLGTSLLVLPTSLIANWENEIKRFSPKLKYHIVHMGLNPESKKILLDTALTLKYDLVITTYGLVHRYEEFKEHNWNYILLDEAQAIKNSHTKQTKAVKALKANNRIVLTGTPIENRLSDLWSIYDFINPGLLGNSKEFSSYTKKIINGSSNNGSSNNGHSKNVTIANWSRLRNVVSPYLLRRVKSDKNIISDLPDKIEMKSYADLSKKQIVLYQDYLQKLQEDLKKQECQDGIKRKGLVLASLIKLKQICNHPDQYLGNSEYVDEDSGKFQRLIEIAETIYAKREKVLIFTQFTEIIPALNNHLKKIFNKDGVILHGAIPSNKRKEIVEKFQNQDAQYVPYFILSLKAGGVGLNLTAANHVIHFDRWWNPAVENQATDRAFRIGQSKKVLVHKFISRGTLEERIDKMIEEKTKLSQEIIQGGSEDWITEMSDSEIFNLFKLNL
ncbi:MAG: DEAD/DEAH box helicase [Oligoflexia bacterium]|nr:DEAD/DEAH box helicase [Oligoflexia bacterium]